MSCFENAFLFGDQNFSSGDHFTKGSRQKATSGKLELEALGEMNNGSSTCKNIVHTAISINVVGLNLQTYKSRPNGAMGIYCNLHITIEEIYKFVFLHVEYFVFLSVKPFLYLFFRRYVVWIILFK